MKKNTYIFAVATALLTLALIRADAQTTSSVPDYLRVSAIVEVDDDRYIGIVDNRDGRSDYLRAGDEFLDFTIASVYPDEQSILLQRDDQQFLLYLRGDKAHLRPLGDKPIVLQKTEGDRIKEEQVVARIQALIQQAEEEARAAGLTTDAEDIKDLHRPVTMEEGLRRMAESAGMPVPENMSTNRTREEFIRDLRERQKEQSSK